MQLTVNKAARVFNVSEDMIYQWIRNDQLPATRFGSRYRINRVKLIEWAHKKGVAIEIEGGLELPVLENAIQRGKVIRNVQARNLLELVEKVVQLLPTVRGLNAEELKKYIGLRRNLGFVLGPARQVAIPDARSPIVFPLPGAIVEIFYLDAPVIIGQSTCSTVIVICVRSASEHLNLLTRILFALSDAEFTARLEKRLDQEALIERLREMSALAMLPKSKNLSWIEAD